MQTNKEANQQNELLNLDAALREAVSKPEAPMTQEQVEQLTQLLFDGRPIIGGAGVNLMLLLAKTCHAINGMTELKTKLKKSPHGEPLVALLPTITKWAQGYVDATTESQESEAAA